MALTLLSIEAMVTDAKAKIARKRSRSCQVTLNYFGRQIFVFYKVYL